MKRLMDKTFFSSLAEVEPVCAEIRKSLIGIGLARNTFGIELLLREFINNAIIHGNALDTAKKVRVEVKLGGKYIDIRVTDEGCGFDWREKIKNTPGETDTSGRGLAIGEQYAHRMKYNRKGNQVALRIRIEGEGENDRV